METKLSKLKQKYQAGDVRGAIRIAAKFPDLGDDRDAILQAHESYHSPDFYRQIGKNPDALIQAGKAALENRYDLSSA